MRVLRWLAVVAGVVASVAIGAIVDRSSHSVSDTLYASAGPVLLVWLVVGLAVLFLDRRPA